MRAAWTDSVKCSIKFSDFFSVVTKIMSKVVHTIKFVVDLSDGSIVCFLRDWILIIDGINGLD